MIGKRETNKKNMHSKILLAAKKIFETSGYKKSSIAQIAKQAKVSQVTLYKYFPSKHTLFKIFLEDEIEKEMNYSRKELKKIDHISPSDITKILFVDKIIEKSNLEYDEIISEFAGENGDNDVYNFYQDRVRKFWRSFIAKLREAKIVPKRMPDEALMMYFDIWVQYFAEKRQQYSRINGNILKELIPQMRELFFFGMLDIDNYQQKKTLQEIYSNADLKEYNLE
ncbi:MAG: TetR/AcrR family transcriptional regulator [Oenococcus oeni]